MKRAAIILAHGSRLEAANEEICSIVDQLQKIDAGMIYGPAFMSFGEPDLSGAIEEMVSRGVQDIVIMPFFIGLGSHISRDIPELLKREKSKHPHLELKVTEPLAGHPGLIDIILDRVRDVSSLKHV